MASESYKRKFKRWLPITAMFLVALFYLRSRIVMSLWDSGAGEAIRPPRPQLDWTKSLPSPSAAVHETNRRNNPAALRSETSDSSSGQIAAQTFHDLETEFKRRRSVLLHGCKKPGTFSHIQEKMNIFSRSLQLCVIAKVGTTTLGNIRKMMKNKIPATPLSITAIVVRHPLARLASAYRDKYLNGSPLYTYKNEWRKKTGSSGSWKDRFLIYWLPALVTQGFLPHIKEKFKLIRVHKENEIWKQSVLDTLHGRNFTDIMEEFMNASFTFNQFLHHVVWTHDHGMVNNHCMTYTERCNPCRKKFDYILKLDRIQEEFNYLLHEVLGYPKIIQVPVLHRGYNHSLDHSDGQYYANVSLELMKRVLEIYKHDFALFGYKHNL